MVGARRYGLCGGVAACYIKSVKRNFCRVQRLYNSNNKHSVVRNNWTYPWWCVCSVCFAEWNWVRWRVVELVKCLQAQTRGWCHWPVVHWSICCVGGRLAYKRSPNISFVCLYYMVLIILVFLLRFHIHVYCLICIVRMLMLGC